MKSFDGYLKQKLGDGYVLLAGGSHKALSDFAMANAYLPLTGGEMTGNITTSSNFMTIGTGLPDAYYRINATVRHWWIGEGVVSGDGKFVIYDASTPRHCLVIDSSGNIGIGNTSPAYKLDVNGITKIGGGVNNNYLHIYGNVTSTGFALDGNDRPSLYITGNYPALLLLSGVHNTRHGSTLSLGAFDGGNTSGTFKCFTFGTPGKDATWMDLGYGTSTSPHENGIDGCVGTRIVRFNSDASVNFFGGISANGGLMNNVFSVRTNSPDDATWQGAAMQIREYAYTGCSDGTDTWARAPRLAWHWACKTVALICLASNGQLYEAPFNNTNFYRIVYENPSDTFNINISGNANTASTAGTAGGLFVNSDGTLKIWTQAGGGCPVCGTETVCILSLFDGLDPLTDPNGYISAYTSRCVIALQPKGGYVGVNTIYPSYPLHIEGTCRATSFLSGGTSIFEQNNLWLTPSRVQIGRIDGTAYSDRACVGVTNGNLHIDAYNGYSMFLNYYCPGAIYFASSSYCVSSGNMYMANYYTTSDRSKKQNISSFSEHIRKFQLKDTEKWHYGVIAQEVPEIFRDGEEGNMTVNYNSVLSYYIGCLENKVAELEEKISKLENK